MPTSRICSVGDRLEFEKQYKIHIAPMNENGGELVSGDAVGLRTAGKSPKNQQP